MLVHLKANKRPVPAAGSRHGNRPGKFNQETLTAQPCLVGAACIVADGVDLIEGAGVI